MNIKITTTQLSFTISIEWPDCDVDTVFRGVVPARETHCQKPHPYRCISYKVSRDSC